MSSNFFLIFLALISVPLACSFRQQSVGVRGRLLCGTAPLNDTQVKLWNKNKLGERVIYKDTSVIAASGTDDQLAATKTDSTGNFQLTGGLGEILPMNVHFKIYHDCNDGIKPCQRKVDLGIPGEYVTRSENVKKWFEAGAMNMEFKFPDEERSCTN
ncbi:Transthyretin-like family protein [Aphelenchoides avenae]|nr:Transthyretin-like family protein [Aphelenchus avenae]